MGKKGSIKNNTKKQAMIDERIYPKFYPPPVRTIHRPVIPRDSVGEAVTQGYEHPEVTTRSVFSESMLEYLSRNANIFNREIIAAECLELGLRQRFPRVAEAIQKEIDGIKITEELLN